MCRHCSCCLVLPLTIQFEDHFCQIGAKLLNLRIIFTKMNQHGAKWSKIIEVGDNFYTIIVVNRSINILTCFQCQLIVELLLNREKQYDHIFKSFQVLNGFRWHRAAWFNEFILFNVQQSKIKWMKRVKEENRFFYIYTGDRGTVEKVIENIYVCPKSTSFVKLDNPKCMLYPLTENTKTLQTQNMCCNICSVVQHLLQWKFLRSRNPCWILIDAAVLTLKSSRWRASSISWWKYFQVAPVKFAFSCIGQIVV